MAIEFLEVNDNENRPFTMKQAMETTQKFNDMLKNKRKGKFL